MKIAQEVKVDLSSQRMFLYKGPDLLVDYAISTSRKGPGEQIGSGCTPRGLHRIRIKIGENAPENSVFISRRKSGEIYTPDLGNKFPDRDWILTRILWLTGMESGLNRGGNRDTLRRFIYIHGCPDSEPVGIPLSHGCIRMRNKDVIDFFHRVDLATIIKIT